MVLLLPVALSGGAAPHRSAVYSVFIVFFGMFGGCIPLVTDHARGWSEKVLLTGYGAHRWLGERLASGSAIDTVQLTPILVLLLLISRAEAAMYPLTLLVVAQALLTANALGSIIARLVDSVAEAALVCSGVALFALHFSGVFRTPVTASWLWYVGRLSPFRPLKETMDRVALGIGSDIAVGEWLAPVVATAVLLAVAAGLAPRLARASLWERPASPPNRRSGSV